jgi:hypothetical protein
MKKFWKVEAKALGKRAQRNAAFGIKPKTDYADGKPTPEAQAWRSMIARCYNPANKMWHRYGGRGIKVCNIWRDDYYAFLKHVGRRPSPDHSLDRYPNPDGNYEPFNVRWANRSEQRCNWGAGTKGRVRSNDDEINQYLRGYDFRCE